MINNEKKHVTEPAVEMGLNPFTKDCLLAPSDYPPPQPELLIYYIFLKMYYKLLVSLLDFSS